MEDLDPPDKLCKAVRICGQFGNDEIVVTGTRVSICTVRFNDYPNTDVLHMLGRVEASSSHDEFAAGLILPLGCIKSIEVANTEPVIQAFSEDRIVILPGGPRPSKAIGRWKIEKLLASLRQESLTLPRAAARIMESIVAFVRPGHLEHPMQGVIGTGFVVDANGLVATNRHVVSKLEKEAERSGLSNAEALMFKPAHLKLHVARMPILGTLSVEKLESASPRPFRMRIPDIALVRLGVRDLPAIELAANGVDHLIGQDVAAIGFPFGGEMLLSDVKPTQFSPSLCHGVVSAHRPGAPFPVHELVLDMTAQKGMSGSPVFVPATASVIGMVYGGIGSKGISTNISFAIPSKYICQSLSQGREVLKSSKPSIESLPAFSEIIEESEIVTRDVP